MLFSGDLKCVFFPLFFWFVMNHAMLLHWLQGLKKQKKGFNVGAVEVCFSTTLTSAGDDFQFLAKGELLTGAALTPGK